MRSFPALVATCLTGLLLAGLPARAQQKSGWVDPPAKTGETTSGAKTKEMAKGKEETGTAEPAEAKVADDRDSARQARSQRRSTRREVHRGIATPSEIDTTARDPRFSGWAGRAQFFTGEYLDNVSAPNEAMIASAPRFYGEHVRFHGRTMSIGALVAEKRRFVRRWPERRYKAQGSTMRTDCNTASATCTVRTVIGFRAESPGRHARSQGLSELTLTVSFAGERPVIVSESSRVLRRGSAALSSFEHGRDGGA